MLRNWLEFALNAVYFDGRPDEWKAWISGKKPYPGMKKAILPRLKKEPRLKSLKPGFWKGVEEVVYEVTLFTQWCGDDYSGMRLQGEYCRYDEKCIDEWISRMKAVDLLVSTLLLTYTPDVFSAPDNEGALAENRKQIVKLFELRQPDYFRNTFYRKEPGDMSYLKLFGPS